MRASGRSCPVAMTRTPTTAGVAKETARNELGRSNPQPALRPLAVHPRAAVGAWGPDDVRPLPGHGHPRPGARLALASVVGADGRDAGRGGAGLQPPDADGHL